MPGTIPTVLPADLVVPQWDSCSAVQGYRSKVASTEQSRARVMAARMMAECDTVRDIEIDVSSDVEDFEPPPRLPIHVPEGDAQSFILNPIPRGCISRKGIEGKIRPRSHYVSAEEQKLHEWLLLHPDDKARVQNAWEVSQCPTEFRLSLRRSHSRS